MKNGSGREVVIVEAARTPVGRGHREKGYYKDTHPSTLLGSAYRAVVERAGIDAELVEQPRDGGDQQLFGAAGEGGVTRRRRGGHRRSRRGNGRSPPAWRRR